MRTVSPPDPLSRVTVWLLVLYHTPIVGFLFPVFAQKVKMSLSKCDTMGSNQVVVSPEAN